MASRIEKSNGTLSELLETHGRFVCVFRECYIPECVCGGLHPVIAGDSWPLMAAQAVQLTKDTAVHHYAGLCMTLPTALGGA